MRTIVSYPEVPRNRIDHAGLYAATQHTYDATWTDATGTLHGTARELWTTGAILEFHTLGCAERFVVRRSDSRLTLGEDLTLRQARTARLVRCGCIRFTAVPERPPEEKKMTKQALMIRLENELAILRQEGEYSVKDFKVFDAPRDVELGSALVRREKRTWSWGSCRSETCNHNSHDPYTSGDTLFLLCSEKLGDSSNGWERFALQDGRLVEYRYAKEHGYYFAPTASLRFAK